MPGIFLLKWTCPFTQKCFILIFARRGDHIAFEIEKGHTPLKTSYFLEAMEMYR